MAYHREAKLNEQKINPTKHIKRHIRSMDSPINDGNQKLLQIKISLSQVNGILLILKQKDKTKGG